MLKKLFDSTAVEVEVPFPELQMENGAQSVTDDTTLTKEVEAEDGPVDDLEEVGEIDLPLAASEDVVAEVLATEEISAVRELIVKLHPAIVPELITGDSIEALISSIEPAQDAYKRVISGVNIPAGGNAPVSLDVEALPTFDKIRRGIANARR